MNDIIIPAKYRRDLDNAEYQVNAAHALLENIIEPMIHCTTCEGLLIEYSAQTGGDLNKAPVHGWKKTLMCYMPPNMPHSSF